MPKEAHLHPVERHDGIIPRGMLTLMAEAEGEGVVLTEDECLGEATAAKGMVDESGGYTPMRGVIGRNPDYSAGDWGDGEEGQIEIAV